jgi:hypothetical protein
MGLGELQGLYGNLAGGYMGAAQQEAAQKQAIMQLMGQAIQAGSQAYGYSQPRRGNFLNGQQG